MLTSRAETALGGRDLTPKDPQNLMEQRLSTFPMLQPFNTVPCVVLTPNHKSIVLLSHNCNFATVANRHVNICVL